METAQFNIRLPTELLSDLDIISKLLKINKSEWIKAKLAEEVHGEKNKLLMELSNLYASGAITKNEIEKLVGREVAETMESIRRTAMRSVKIGKKYGKELEKIKV